MTLFILSFFIFPSTSCHFYQTDFRCQCRFFVVDCRTNAIHLPKPIPIPIRTYPYIYLYQKINTKTRIVAKCLDPLTHSSIIIIAIIAIIIIRQLSSLKRKGQNVLPTIGEYTRSFTRHRQTHRHTCKVKLEIEKSQTALHSKRHTR